jgi:ubiquinone/menaquinone biosynthesis C-methylase UbiE
MEKEMVWGPQMFKDHFENTTNNSIILSALEDRKFKFYMSELHLKKTDVFLDAGCGYGRLAKAIKADVQHVIGIDINPDNVEFSKQYVGAGFEGHVVDLSKGILPFKDKSIDKIVFDNVLMFFDEKTQWAIFKEVKRVLKSDGKLAFNFENSEYTFNGLARFFISLYKFKAKLQGNATPVHHKYSLSFYERLLAELGFGKDIKSIGGTFYKKMGLGPIEVLPVFLHSYIAKLDARSFNTPKKRKMAGITVSVSAQ